MAVGSTRGTGVAVLRGIAAVVAGLGAGELVAGLVAPTASPLGSVAGALVELAPGWAIEAGIQAFGVWDKLVLITAIALVVVGLGALAGVLESRRPPTGTVLIALGGGVGLVAAFALDQNAMSGLPAAVALVVAVVAFRLLVRAARDRVPAPPGAGEPDARPGPPEAEGVPRRAVLGWAAGLTIAGAVAAVVGTSLSGLARVGAGVAAALRLPRPARAAAAIPADAQLAIPGITPVMTPIADFYRVDTAFVVPTLAPEDWRLRIHGLVDREIELGWDDLTALEFEEFDVTLMCVSNPVGGSYNGTARWLGTRLRPLLELAGPRPESDMVLSTSVDGWTASTPLEVLRDPDRAAFLAIGMNGEPLPAQHGAPVRMVVAGLYGYVSATKWVTSLELTRFDTQTAYWTRNGWSARGPVKLQSRIDVPRPGADLAPGRIEIAGVAWYPPVGVSGVEVRIDDGPWRPAALAAAVGADTWVQWHYAWDAPPGFYDLAVRAIGADGQVQTEVRQGALPDGATGHHTIRVAVA